MIFIQIDDPASEQARSGTTPLLYKNFIVIGAWISKSVLTEGNVEMENLLERGEAGPGWLARRKTGALPRPLTVKVNILIQYLPAKTQLRVPRLLPKNACLIGREGNSSLSG